MFSLDRIKNFFDLRQTGFNFNLKEKFSAATQFFLGDQDGQAQHFRTAFQSLVYPLLCQNGTLTDKNRMIYRRLLEEYFNLQVAETYLGELNYLSPIPTEEAVQIIKETSGINPVQTAEFLIVLSVSLQSANHDFPIQRTALALGMTQENYNTFYRQAVENQRRKQRLKNSSCSIIATLVIILIFFLTAKYLQSVIFGVLLACILLPMEKFFEKRLQKRSSMIFLLSKSVSYIFYPLKQLSILLSRKSDVQAKKLSRQRNLQKKRLIRQAVILTCATVSVVMILAAFGISRLTGHYMKDLQNSLKVWEKKQNYNGAAPAYKANKFNYALEKIRQNFESIPLVQTGLDYLGKVINDPAKKDQMLKNIIRSNGGIVNITGGVVGGIAAFLCDILLTVFFALLFLIKFAEYSSEKHEKVSGSEYIVRNFFNGIWLPGADENLINDTCKLINGIIFRLRIWLKGYITLILVDSSVYTTCFFFLGVPFFLPLGLISGCGIALPYLGPIISCLLTVLVTIASGAATGEMLLAIVICYLIYNGIIEQFILYPAVIGESLGLSTLETIIVVLLGAIFAGIPGMIFALPTASVAKFIIPQIYHGFTLSRKG